MPNHEELHQWIKISLHAFQIGLHHYLKEMIDCS
jgi:hypothetical protein